MLIGSGLLASVHAVAPPVNDRPRPCCPDIGAFPNCSHTAYWRAIVGEAVKVFCTTYLLRLGANDR